MLVALASVVVDHSQQHLQTGRMQGPCRHLELGDPPAGPSFSCRTTPTRLIARWPAAPAPRSAAGSSGSSSWTRPATARALQGERGPRRAWRSAPRNRSTPESTARRWNSARRCGSLPGRRRCGSGSPRTTRAPRRPRASASPAAPARHGNLRDEGGTCQNDSRTCSGTIRLHPETHAAICGSEGITVLCRPYKEGTQNGPAFGRCGTVSF